jgi:hypothetical protein
LPEKLGKYEPEESALEFAGMVNFSELGPEALTAVSSVGATPEPLGKMPELLPKPPAISEAASKPTHLTTPGCAHRVAKSWLPGGEDAGGGGVPPPPPAELPKLEPFGQVVESFPLHAANAATARIRSSEVFARSMGSCSLDPRRAILAAVRRESQRRGREFSTVQ